MVGSDHYEERAAIIEFDAGKTRHEAEILAREKLCVCCGDGAKEVVIAEAKARGFTCDEMKIAQKGDEVWAERR